MGRQPGARRVEQHERRPAMAAVGAFQPALYGGRANASVCQTGRGDVPRRKLGGARLSFDPNDQAEAAREWNREQPNPTVEVDRQTRCWRWRRPNVRGIAERLRHQRVEHEWVDLKEAVGVVRISLSGNRRVDRQRLRQLQRRGERDAVVTCRGPELGRPLRQSSRFELRAQLLVSIGKRGNDERVFRQIDHPARPRLEIPERRLIRIVAPLRAGAVLPYDWGRRDLDRIGQFDPANAAQAVGNHAALGGYLSVIPQVLKIRAAPGEEGMRFRDAIGTGFENGDDRCVSDAAVLAVDTDTQAITRRGARDEEGASASEAEPEPARDDALDHSFGLVARSSGKDHWSDALGSVLARCHAQSPLRLGLTHELRSTSDRHGSLDPRIRGKGRPERVPPGGFNSRVLNANAS